LGPAEKAAALADSVIRRQPFVDGNKRVAAMAAARVMDLFGLDLIAHPLELADVIRDLDSGRLSEGEVADWLDDHCLPLEDKER